MGSLRFSTSDPYFLQMSTRREVKINICLQEEWLFNPSQKKKLTAVSVTKNVGMHAGQRQLFTGSPRFSRVMDVWKKVEGDGRPVGMYRRGYGRLWRFYLVQDMVLKHSNFD